MDFQLALKICDAVTIWNQMNLTLPHWLDVDAVDKCTNLGHLEYSITYTNHLLTKFRGSPLALHMLDNMNTRAKSFLQNQSGLRMISFFAHDSTISALLGHVNSFNHMKPPLASTLILELYHDIGAPVINNEPMSQFFVRLLFRNETGLPPSVLNIGICKEESSSRQADCRLDILQNSLHRLAVEDLFDECGIIDIVDYYYPSKYKIINTKGKSRQMNSESRKFKMEL